MSIELLLWIYGIGIIIALMITGYINYADDEISGEAVLISVIVSALWPLFAGLFIMSFIYGIGAGAQVLVRKMFGDKNE